MKLDKKLIEQIEKITFTNYEVNEDIVPLENIETMLIDLVDEIKHLKEKNKGEN